MYRFEWSKLITSGVLDQIRTLAGIAPGESIEAARPALASILGSTGGQPFVSVVPSEAERSRWVLRVLGDAVCHTLGQAPRVGASGGYRATRTGIVELGKVAKASPRTAINWATAAEIAAATGVSLNLAENIVADRRANGAFRSVDDLDTRLKGVNVRNREHFASALSFDAPAALSTERAAPTGDLGTDLRTLLDLQAEGPNAERLTAALESAAASAALEPHPTTRMNQRRDLGTPAPAPATSECKWIGVLFGAAYYEALQTMFADATTAIDIAMFHVAFASEAHPTRKLLDALKAAHARGVAVRVLLDRDRRTDPYRSTLINSRAKKALEAAGVPVRFDAEESLLHSKFLVVDRKLAIVGSHNWSAGSYSGFDDLTLVLSSTALAVELGARFETMWNAAP